METCYVYFNCRKTDCIMYGKEETKCWEHDATLCVHPHLDNEFFKKRGLHKCAMCLYIKSLNPEIKL